MNNHNLVIYELDELYKILVEIKKDINLSFEKVNKQKLSDLESNEESSFLETFSKLIFISFLISFKILYNSSNS